jgi:hypothetical protein
MDVRTAYLRQPPATPRRHDFLIENALDFRRGPRLQLPPDVMRNEPRGDGLDQIICGDGRYGFGCGTGGPLLAGRITTIGDHAIGLTGFVAGIA